MKRLLLAAVAITLMWAAVPLTDDGRISMAVFFTTELIGIAMLFGAIYVHNEVLPIVAPTDPNEPPPDEVDCRRID